MVAIGRRNKMITTRTVASLLNVHINTVRRWSNQGILKGYRIGPRGDRRFIRDEIMELLNSNGFGYKPGADNRDGGQSHI